MKLRHIVFFGLFVFALMATGLYWTSRIDNSVSASVRIKTTADMNGEDTVRFPIDKSDSEWRNILSTEEYNVLRQKGTESPFSGKYNNFHDKGVFICAGCGHVLFNSEAKFDSGSGWPSFVSPITENTVIEIDDHSLGMYRTEVLCAHCGGHLGHVFTDGPKPSGLRYCINSVALDFKKQ